MSDFGCGFGCGMSKYRFGCDPSTRGFRVFSGEQTEDDPEGDLFESADDGSNGGVMDAVQQVAQGVASSIAPSIEPYAYAMIAPNVPPPPVGLRTQARIREGGIFPPGAPYYPLLARHSHVYPYAMNVRYPYNLKVLEAERRQTLERLEAERRRNYRRRFGR